MEQAQGASLSLGLPLPAVRLHPTASGSGNFPWTSGPGLRRGRAPPVAGVQVWCRAGALGKVWWEHRGQHGAAQSCSGCGTSPTPPRLLVKAAREISILDPTDSGQVRSQTLINLDPHSLWWWRREPPPGRCFPSFALSLCSCTLPCFVQQLKIMASKV